MRNLPWKIGLSYFQWILPGLDRQFFQIFLFNPFFPQVAMLQRHGYEDVLGKVPDYYWPRMRDHLKPLHPHAIPCLLFGDESQALGSSYMVLTWMSEVNPVMTDSLFSRHIITLIPAERYHIVDGVNITLMAAYSLFSRAVQRHVL